MWSSEWWWRPCSSTGCDRYCISQLGYRHCSENIWAGSVFSYCTALSICLVLIFGIAAAYFWMHLHDHNMKYKKLSCCLQTARHICANATSWLKTCAASYVCDDAEFSRSASADVGISREESLKLRSGGPRPWNAGRDWPRGNDSPYICYRAESFALGQTHTGVVWGPKNLGDAGALSRGMGRGWPQRNTPLLHLLPSRICSF